MQARRLILTADDLGRTPEVNAAIADWVQAGAITHTSLMVNEPYAASAVAWCWTQPQVRVGLHLTLCDGWDCDGYPLPATPTGAGLRYAFFPSARAWLRREIERQFERFLDWGFPPGHWDGHTHLHLHPVVLALTIPVAQRFGFQFTRLVREPGRPALIPWIFQRLSARALPRLQQAGIGYADRVFGLRKSGRMDEAEIQRALAWAKAGTTEIYFHPGAEKVLKVPVPIRGAV